MDESKKIIIYNGRRYYYNKGYYFFTERLHRRMWEDAHGPIPDNHHIHHINGDSTDNRLENLECIHKSKHHSMHFSAQRQVEAMHCAEGRRKRSVWAKSEKGKKSCSEASKKQWENRESVTRTCTICLAEYTTKNYGRAKFCSQKCRTKGGYLDSLIGLTCIICSSPFRAQKGRSKTCSPKCAGALSSKTKKGVISDSVSATYG